MRNPIRRWLDDRRRLARHHADARVTFAHEQRAITELTEDLARTADHGARSTILDLLSEAEDRAARARVQGWRDRPQRNLGGRPLSVVLRYRARLHQLVADVEGALATDSTSRQDTDTALEAAAGQVLDHALEVRRVDRAMLVALSDVVEPLVGAEAACAVRYLPMPVEEPPAVPIVVPLWERSPAELAAAGITYAMEDDEAPVFRDAQGRELDDQGQVLVLRRDRTALCHWCNRPFTWIARDPGRTDKACDDHVFWLRCRERDYGYGEQPPTRVAGARSDTTGELTASAPARGDPGQRGWPPDQDTAKFSTSGIAIMTGHDYL